ncbi:hypothetical protein ACFWDI_14710 [Streptomyces sp. NPDC060064]|uniref:hypothetical protein n=1 Tax=Streptomyces sp. NPDC060064 TaxID=3347049 RepID=UPI00367C0D50
MRLLRRLAALATVLALTWIFAPSAVAGGPTSVLITSPESGETASLYYSDKEYTALLDLLGAEKVKGRKERPPSLDMAVGTRQVNVTWMVHDVAPWRVDRVYPGERPGLVWIHTATEPTPQQGYWHQARNPAELTRLFKKLGLMGKKSGGSGVAMFPPAWGEEQGQDRGGSSEAAAPPQEERRQPAAAAAGDGTTDWWWAISGLAAGAVLALVLRPVASRLPRPPFGRGGGTPETGPRQELLDS